MTQLTGSTGQVGSIAAAVPMTWALSELGWTPAYLISAAVGPLLLAALLLFVRDSPDARHVRGHPMSRVTLLAPCARRGHSRAPAWASGCTSRRRSALTSW